MQKLLLTSLETQRSLKIMTKHSSQRTTTRSWLMGQKSAVLVISIHGIKLGYCNYNNVVKLSNIVDGMKIKRRGTCNKATLSNRDIDMSLLCLQLTPMDHVIPSPGELLFNRKLVSNLPTKCTNSNARKAKIQDHWLHRQLLQKKQHDQHAKDLLDLNTEQLVCVEDHDTRKWTPAVVRQACTKPCSYIIETPTRQVLHRNHRHFKEDINNFNNTSP